MGPIITQGILKDMVRYDPDSGIFYSIKSYANRIKPGDVLGADNGRGYLRCKLLGKNYMLHRLAFLYLNGELPVKEIDHINQNRKDNRWINLREVDRIENLRNMKKSRFNTCGYSGVTYNKKHGKYYAQISIKKKRVHIGSFCSAKEAGDAYRKALLEYGFHENHGR